MNTCNSISHRFTLVSERVSNTSQLLRTKVDIIIGKTKSRFTIVDALRAKMQLRMQQMVEGISMVAIPIMPRVSSVKLPKPAYPRLAG